MISLRRVSISLVAGLVWFAILSAAAAASNAIDDDPAAWEFSDGSIAFRCVDQNGQPVPGAELSWCPRRVW